ncbi:MAG: hypothetical protein LBI82_00415 [Dysgonamonadaceae bacterium]|jgi:hypothetical protein|nr:hypothetical protein [Dysgonamonadaceae bacterium]
MRNIKKYNTNLARVPQHMSFDSDAITQQFQRQAGLVRDIFLFTVKRQFSGNIFGEIEFTVDEFCKEMGYNKSEMYRRMDIFREKSEYNEKKHPLPKPPSLVDGHECDGLLEYSLYRAARENVVFHRYSKNGNPEIRAYQILQSVEVIYDKSTQKSVKRKYSIVLSADILNEAFFRFFVIDYSNYIALASKSSDATSSYRNFYVFYGRMVATAKYQNRHTYITTVDELVEIFNYNQEQEPKHKKMSVRRALDAIKKKLSHPFNYKFVADAASKSKLQYHVLFTFTDDVLEYYDERMMYTFWTALRQRGIQHFAQKIMDKNYDYKKMIEMQKNMPKERLEEFHKWWFSKEDYDFKQMLLEELKREIFSIEAQAVEQI